MMRWLRRLPQRPALLTIIANNSTTFSATFANLLSVPIALHFLSAQEFGLWAFTSQSIGYFLLFDFGVSTAISRIMAGPIAAGDAASSNQWFTLSLLVMAVQALTMIAAGWLLAGQLLAWFEIPGELLEEAHELWLWMITLSALRYTARVMGGILYAQNRFYWNGFGGTVGTWAGLVAFILFMVQGHGLMAYAYSSAVQAVCSSWLPWWAVHRGSHRFCLDFRDLSLTRVRRLYGFSGALFLSQIANLLLISGQTMVITKLLGLEAAAGYNVSSKIILTARTVLWQLFESFLPGWQRLYLKGQFVELLNSWHLRFDLVLSAALTVGCLCLALNPWFVGVWARPDLHQGFNFDLASVLFCIVVVITGGFGFPQVFAMRVWTRSALHLLAAVVSVAGGVMLVKPMGTAGVFWAGVVAYIITVGWYNILQFRRIMGSRSEEHVFHLTQFKSSALAGVLLACALVVGFTENGSPFRQVLLGCILSAAAVIIFLSIWTREIKLLMAGRAYRSQSI